MNRQSFAAYVHEFIPLDGATRYYVARYDEKAGQYYQPHDKRTAKLTGCFGRYARRVDGLGMWYVTRKAALRRARYLFGSEAA